MTKKLSSSKNSLLLALLLVTSIAKPMIWQDGESATAHDLLWNSYEYQEQYEYQENTTLTSSPCTTSTSPIYDVSNIELDWHLDNHQEQLDWAITENFPQVNDINHGKTLEWDSNELVDNQFELRWHSDKHQEQSDNQENTIIPLSPYKTRNLLISPLQDISNTPLHWHTDKHQEQFDKEMTQRLAPPSDVDPEEAQEEESVDKYFELRWYSDEYQAQYDNDTKVEVIGLIWDDNQELEIPVTAARYSGVLKNMINTLDPSVDIEKLIFPTGNPCRELVEAIAHSLEIVDKTLNDFSQVKKLFREYLLQLPKEMQSRLKVAIHNLEIKTLIRYYEKIPVYNLHPLNKKFKCDWPGCFYSADQKCYVKKHRKIHTGEKFFKCLCCEYSCALKAHLQLHMRTHSGSKPFVCNVCGKGFSQKPNLNTHERTHLDEKMYKCHGCDKYSTSDKSNFNRHIKSCFG